LEVAALEVVEKAATSADEHQQAAAGVVVFAVRSQMLGEHVDPLGEQRDLNLGPAGVVGALAELGDQLLLALKCYWHAAGEASRGSAAQLSSVLDIEPHL